MYIGVCLSERLIHIQKEKERAGEREGKSVRGREQKKPRPQHYKTGLK